jgi:hypothetical protein
MRKQLDLIWARTCCQVRLSNDLITELGRKVWNVNLNRKLSSRYLCWAICGQDSVSAGLICNYRRLDTLHVDQLIEFARLISDLKQKTWDLEISEVRDSRS